MMHTASCSDAASHAVEGLLAVQCENLVLCSEAAQRKAAVLLALCARHDVVLHWVRWQQLQVWHRRGGIAYSYRGKAVNEWVDKWAEHADVLRMLNDPMDADRQRLLQFVAEFETHLAIEKLHRRGLRVPASHVVATYAAALEKHALTAASEAHIQRLRSKATTSQKWGRAFRKRWGHEWGSGHVQHGVTTQDIQKRSGIYFRWVNWAFAQLSMLGEPIVINMDETMLSSVKPMKLGVVPDRQRAGLFSMHGVRREVQLPRTSLIACVCNDSTLQATLPQMRLPRGPKGRIAGSRARAAYAEAGTPQMTLHGSGGWNNADTCSVWLRSLAQRLRRAAPGRPILLVMDDCSVHVSETLLRRCVAWSIGLVIIPSRMTWMLQPCDTHVFSRLKSSIRKKCFEEVARSGSGSLAPGKRIRLHGEAIREVLCDSSWTAVMERSGLSGPGHDLRPSVAQSLSGVDLVARFPSEEELQEALSVPVVRAGRLLRLLLDTVSAARRGPRALPAAAAASTDPVEPPAPVPLVVPVPTLRLGTAARLPPGRSRRELAETIILARRTRSPVLTRRRSAAALAEAALAAAVPGASAASSAAAAHPVHA